MAWPWHRPQSCSSSVSRFRGIRDCRKIGAHTRLFLPEFETFDEPEKHEKYNEFLVVAILQWPLAEHKCKNYFIVQNQVQIALTESCLLVLQSEM